MTDKSERKKKECQICGKEVLKLIRHMKVHYELKPFKCENCGKEFKRKQNLTEHQIIHTEAMHNRLYALISRHRIF